MPVAVHMDKEEEHLLPLFLKTMNNVEIAQMLDMSKKTVNLLNSRHRNSINCAREAAGMSNLDDGSADPPPDVDSPTYFFDGEGLHWEMDDADCLLTSAST